MLRLASAVFLALATTIAWTTIPTRAADTAAPVTFAKDVLPILQKNCQSCHRPRQIAPMSLVTYKDARPWAKAIQAAVTMRTMPPGFADQRYGHLTMARSLKPNEIAIVAAWGDGRATV